MKYFWIWLCFLLLLSPTLALEEPHPAWETYGNVINDTPGNTPQQNPKLVSDSYGGYISVWEDGRSGFHNIYSQKTDENGRRLWTKEGVPAGRTPGNQNFPNAAGDGSGGVIIVWQDYRNGNSDIYAQRINHAGTPLWGERAVPICFATAGQFAPEIISDGAGGAIITWHDYRSGKGEDIFAQRIDGNGSPLWKKDGIPISLSPGTQWYPKLTSDNSGGAFIVWTDGRISSSDNNIYAQHIDSAGNPQWEKNGSPICTAPKNQESPVIVSISEGAIIAWNDNRSGNTDIYLQKVDRGGNLLWEKEGVAACQLIYSQENPNLSEDGAGGAIVVWTDHRAEKSDIYAQRIYHDGRVAWQANGRPICQAGGAQNHPQILKLKTDNWIVIWEDQQDENIDIFAQKINSSGTPLWQTNGITLAAASHSQESASAGITPGGDMIVAWEDNRFGNYDIYSQKVTPNGDPLWAKNGIVVCAAPGSVVQQNMALTFNKHGEIILVFEDARSGFFNIYAQKINRAEKLAWGENGIAIAKISANQSTPQIVPDGSGGAIICWEDHRSPDFPKIRAQHLNAGGRKLWESSLPLANSRSRQVHPLMLSDGAGGAIVAWQDDRDVLSLEDIYVQRISGKGKLIWGNKGKIAISANGNQEDAEMIADGKDGVFLAWTDYRRGDRNPDIYVQRISSQGKVLWQEDGILVCGAPDVQRTPRVSRDGEGGAIIAWTDKGGGSYDIYAQRVNQAGETIWMKDGIPINQASRTQQNAKFGKTNVLVWEDYRYGNWDIFAGAVDIAGSISWEQDGVPIAMIPHTQYAPESIPWKDGSVIVTWEDYRSGKHYEIYVQQLDKNGSSSWVENGTKVRTKNGGRAPKVLTNSSDNSFYVFWEDHSHGGRAIYGQRYILN
jgi:hypothetical protein